jgi:hypothetical protein
MRIGASLDAHVRANQLGKVFAAETGFILSATLTRREHLMRPSWQPNGCREVNCPRAFWNWRRISR